MANSGVTSSHHLPSRLCLGFSLKAARKVAPILPQASAPGLAVLQSSSMTWQAGKALQCGKCSSVPLSLQGSAIFQNGPEFGVIRSHWLQTPFPAVCCGTCRWASVTRAKLHCDCCRTVLAEVNRGFVADFSGQAAAWLLVRSRFVAQMQLTFSIMPNGNSKESYVYKTKLASKVSWSLGSLPLIVTDALPPERYAVPAPRVQIYSGS